MYLKFKDECFYPEDYKDFESFWEVLPKDKNGELEKYYPKIDFIGINNFSLSYPTTKESVQKLYNFLIKLDDYDVNYSVYVIIYGLYLWFDYNLCWDDLGDVSNEVFNYIEERFAFESDNDSDMVYDYLNSTLGLNKYQIETILKYFDTDSFIEDNFAVNGSYYYYLDQWK